MQNSIEKCKDIVVGKLAGAGGTGRRWGKSSQTMQLPGTVVTVKGFTSGVRQGTIATAVVAGKPMASESEYFIVRRCYRPSLHKTL